MLDSISAAVGDERVYLLQDQAGFHRNLEVRRHSDKLNIEPIWNVAYRFEFNPCERLWSQYKQHYRKVLLQKMLDGPMPRDTPLKDALFETFCALDEDVKRSIPKFIKKALGLVRREANEIRR